MELNGVRLFRRVDLMTGSTILYGRRRDGRGQPTYALAVSIAREFLEDTLAKRGRDAVRRYENLIQRRIVAELADDATKHRHYKREGDAVAVHRIDRLWLRSLRDLPKLRATLSLSTCLASPFPSKPCPPADGIGVSQRGILKHSASDHHV